MNLVYAWVVVIDEGLKTETSARPTPDERLCGPPSKANRSHATDTRWGNPAPGQRGKG